jgi:hypothetical protein
LLFSRRPPGFVLNPGWPLRLRGTFTDPAKKGMYSGTLINDLFALVERINAQRISADRVNTERVNADRVYAEPADVEVEHAHSPARNAASPAQNVEGSQPKQFPQPLGLSSADRDLSLLFVIHPQLVGALKPRDDFPDAVDVYQIGAVRPPKKICV